MAALSSDLRIIAFTRFSIRLDPKSEDPIAWLKDRERRKALGDAVFAIPLFRDRLKVGKKAGGDFAPITAKTGPAIVGTSGEIDADFQDVDDLEWNLFVRVSLAEDNVELRVQATAAALIGHEASALDDIVAFVQRVSEAMKGVAGLSVGYVQAELTQRGLDYPRSRPPRENSNYPERSIITFLDPAFHTTEHPYARAGEPKKLTSPPPPSPAKVSTDGELVTVRWARTLADADLVAAAAGHSAWIESRVDTGIADGFNELGDRRESRGNGKPTPPLTFYSPRWRLGYKAVLVMPDGSVEDDAWNEAAKIAKAKKLADGSPVDSMRIVVPLREHVFVVADRAKAAGFDAVLYPDDAGAFWNPDPPGNWLTPPVKTSKPPKDKGARK